MTLPGISADVFAQPDCRVRLRHGRSGARDAARAGDGLVVVDVLSFSTGAVIAVAQGARVRPCGWGEEPRELVDETSVEFAVRRADVPALGRFSLSPAAMSSAGPGDAIVVRSPNGATCTRYASDVPALWVGALVNASATARAVGKWLALHPRSRVTVLACGERWREPPEDAALREDGPLRIALEDVLGAGAVLDGLRDVAGGLSAEAEACAQTFRACRNDLTRLLATCGSGRELIAAGFPEDPALAAQLDAHTAVARLVDGWLVQDGSDANQM